ncbi:MAG: aminotransferase class I/II-fold pyridoxal phosphate-dependent enzyme, partial [Oscillospiraceae bacterium]
FTGNRCAYTVVPKALKFGGASLNALWNRRQTTKFNGVPYVVQRGAEAVFSEAGQRETRETVAYYMNNAALIRNGLRGAGLSVFGGVNSPYIWAKTPNGINSWDFFNHLLHNAGVVTTPGAGFGPEGEGYIRLTGFGDATATKEAVSRITAVL